MKLYKCSVCNYIYEGEEPLAACPLCGAPAEKHVELPEDVKEKTYKSDYTNGLHAELVGLAQSIIDLCEAGIDDNLDPTCVKIFKASKEAAWTMKQMSKAEIENHVKKEKW